MESKKTNAASSAVGGGRTPESTPPGLPVRAEVLTPPSDSALSRRTALKLLSATALLTVGGVGCTRKPERRIVSVSESPEYQDPGTPLYYASTWTEGQWPYGMKVKASDGRPVKIEGLPEHPLNRGASTAQMQASLLSLYDPERLRSPTRREESVSWEAADKQVTAALGKAQSAVVVTRSLLGPAERSILARLRKAVPGLQHLVWERVHDGERRGAWNEIYGQDGLAIPDFSRAKTIVSIDCDFLGTDGDVLTSTRDFAARRRVEGDPKAEKLSRLYVAESAMTVTGSNADHRIPLRPTQALDFAQALVVAVSNRSAEASSALAKVAGIEPKVARALVGDLRANTGAAVVLAGTHLPAAVHAVVAELNADLGAAGKTLQWNDAPPTLPANTRAEIAAAFGAGPDVALLLDVNPVYDFPDGGFEKLLAKAGLTVAHGLTQNETLAACALALPSAHNLESWNDAQVAPGVLGICQPLIAPLFGGRQAAASLLAWTRALAPGAVDLKETADWHDYLRNQWLQGPLFGSANAGRSWDDALRRGFAGQAKASSFPRLDRAKAQDVAGGAAASTLRGTTDLVLLPHGTVGDGRYAGNAWLQELPDPVSRLVWDNAASVSPATAKALGVEDGDWLSVRIGTSETHVEVPALVQPGVAPDTIVLTLGHGRTRGAGVGDDVGINAAALPTLSETPWFSHAIDVQKTSREPHKLVRTQRIFDQDNRPIVLEGTREEYVGNSAFVKSRQHVPELRQMHAEYDYSKGRKWGMAIDLSACTGCNACTIACQAENNIPVVGKDECSMGREMNWIRIDRYESGDPANPKVSQQPMLCQHCDNAPCENVCPVNATTHSPEGLNEQVYNRCVGTRYCANNCPYKVRRYNFFNYTKENVRSPVDELLHNPQVTVRSRGVMEKCTFCVQRINASKFKAQNADEEIEDGTLVSACQQACPAGAIVFGDLNDSKSVVARMRGSDLAYHVLEEINVRPNVTYLAKVRNPHPDAAEATKAAKGGH